MADKQRADQLGPVHDGQRNVQAARDQGDPRPLSLALANLGLAHFRAKDYEAGMQAFDEAVSLATDLADVRLQVQVLGLKVLAYQDIERFHDAYQTAETILHHAEALDDPGLKCDALATEAQILVQSGEPIIAADKLRFARTIARKIDDKRRQLNVLGALSNVALALNSLDEAGVYLRMALELARELQNQYSELDLQISLSALLIWQDRFPEAISQLEEAFQLAEALDLTEAQLTILRHMTDCYARLNNAEQTLIHAQRGLAIDTQRDPEVTFSLLEAAVLAAYRQEQPELARQAILQGIDLARQTGNQDREVTLLVSLGEADLVAERSESALATYAQALQGARRLQRTTDEAYLVGRIGVIHAEQGRLQEAQRYHEEAISLARQGEMPHLEAEQLCMLALALADQAAAQEAATTCQQAIDVYTRIGNEDGAAQARALLDRIVAAT